MKFSQEDSFLAELVNEFESGFHIFKHVYVVTAVFTNFMTRVQCVKQWGQK